MKYLSWSTLCVRDVHLYSIVVASSLDCSTLIYKLCSSSNYSSSLMRNRKIHLLT